MDRSNHTLACLFSQLGLENNPQDIENFINKHKKLSNDIPLNKAEFWNTAQSDFLLEAIEQDSDWSEVVDTLNALLR